MSADATEKHRSKNFLKRNQQKNLARIKIVCNFATSKSGVRRDDLPVQYLRYQTDSLLHN